MSKGGSMNIKITILSENTVFGKVGVVAEHGFSAYVETSSGNFLFDTGGISGAAVANASVLGINLHQTDTVVLSHGHVDHTGGLLKLLYLRRKPTDVYCHPDLFKDRYWIMPGGKGRTFVGMPYKKTALEGLGARFIEIKQFTELYKEIFLTGEVPRKTDFETGDKDLICGLKEDSPKDNVEDDVSIVIKKDDGLIVLLGCAHAGIINILNYAVEKTGVSKIKGVVGGTHLGMSSEEQMTKSIEALGGFEIEKIVPSHCTGQKGGGLISRKFPSAYIPGFAGTELVF